MNEYIKLTLSYTGEPIYFNPRMIVCLIQGDKYTKVVTVDCTGDIYYKVKERATNILGIPSND